MDSWLGVIHDVDAVERLLDRRRFIKAAAMMVVIPRLSLEPEDREFLARLAGTLIPAGALQTTGIDVLGNIDRLLERGSPDHRAKVLRLIAWARRVSFLYGGERVALNARSSRFVLIQKMGKALSSLCLVAFWGDERSLTLIDSPAVLP
jgi:hypothetical protein